MPDGFAGWGATLAGIAVVGAAVVHLRAWRAARGAVLDVWVERTDGGHRIWITNTGRASAFGLKAAVKVMVGSKPFDPLGATAGQRPDPVHELLRELAAGQDLAVPLILLESADPQLEVVLRWTEGTARRHRRETFRPSYTW